MELAYPNTQRAIDRANRIVDRLNGWFTPWADPRLPTVDEVRKAHRAMFRIQRAGNPRFAYYANETMRLLSEHMHGPRPSGINRSYWATKFARK